MLKDTFKSIVKDTIKRMELVNPKFYSPEAVDLVYETAVVESGNFKYLKQIKGPAIGFTQLEPETVWDCWENYIVFRNVLKHFFEEELKFDHNDLAFCVLTNLALQVAFARIWYYRRPGKIPTTLEGRARYWKIHYNTIKGKGTVEHYLELNKGG